MITVTGAVARSIRAGGANYFLGVVANFKITRAARIASGVHAGTIDSKYCLNSQLLISQMLIS